MGEEAASNQRTDGVPALKRNARYRPGGDEGNGVIEFGDLRDLPVFDGVSDACLSRTAAFAADVRVDAGQWLVREGESAAFYVLLSGSFDLLKRYPDGQRRLALRDQPGDYLGELPIVFGAPFFAGARAVTPLRVARIERAGFGLLVSDSEEFKDRMEQGIHERVEGLEDQAASRLRNCSSASNGRCCDSSALANAIAASAMVGSSASAARNSLSAAAKSPVAVCTLPRLKWHGAQAGSMRNAALNDATASGIRPSRCSAFPRLR